jgi:hypothetical protein
VEQSPTLSRNPVPPSDESDKDAVRRAAFIQSLRACADFLETHTTVPAPRSCDLHVFVHSKEEVIRQARVATWEKVYFDHWFCLRKTFGEEVSLDITIEREAICRRVVTGQRVAPATPETLVDVVEWQCDDALLASRSGQP